MLTNFLEADLAKYERRVRRIEENPDPTKLQANRLLYKVELESRREQLQAAKEGKPFAYTMVSGELMSAMGLHSLGLSGLADRATAYADELLAISRNHGVTDNICDRYRMALGMLLSGAIPKPAVITGASGACTVEMQMLVAAKQLFDVPSYVMDRYFEPDGERLDYFRHQLEEMIEFIEHNVPGTKYNPDDLAERYAKEAEAQKCLQVLFNAAKKIPSPVRGQDMLRIPRLTNACHPGGLEYFHALADEVGDRAAKGFSALKEEKARAMWLVTSTFYDDTMTILEDRGVSVPIYCWENLSVTVGLGEDAFGYNGRKLSPLDEVVRIANGQTWAGPAERWVELCVSQAREYKVDMLVYFMLAGCPSNLCDARIVADRVEKELGIPTLMIDGYMHDKTKYSREEFKSKLNEFVDYVFQMKGIK